MDDGRPPPVDLCQGALVTRAEGVDDLGRVVFPLQHPGSSLSPGSDVDRLLPRWRRTPHQDGTLVTTAGLVPRSIDGREHGARGTAVMALRDFRTSRAVGRGLAPGAPTASDALLQAAGEE
ncbi:hypothetical protein GCM10022197_08620 [Microlunatus spumicola]|uniref:Uncharacterized protein n=1 Tax=Microlunatus spumicola TaxID=81499 RepID=A0ABP6WRT6_9ACTN